MLVQKLRSRQPDAPGMHDDHDEGFGDVWADIEADEDWDENGGADFAGFPMVEYGHGVSNFSLGEGPAMWGMRGAGQWGTQAPGYGPGVPNVTPIADGLMPAPARREPVKVCPIRYLSIHDPISTFAR